jgi:hypothetical protein
MSSRAASLGALMIVPTVKYNNIVNGGLGLYNYIAFALALYDIAKMQI